MRNLRRIVSTFLFSALLAAGVMAQGPQSQQTAQQFNVQPLDTAPSVTGAQALSDFENGSTVRFYFIITHLNSVVSAPTQTANRLGPASLSSSNGHRITITWNSINGATFDVLEASTPVLPVASNCACAVATGLTANNVLDVGSYSSYSTAFTFGLNWNISQSINGSGVPILNFLYNGVGCDIGADSTTSCTSSGGSVTSVGLAYLGPEFSVGNSPITSTGVLNVSKTVQQPNTVWAGPGQNSTTGIFDGEVSNLANTVTSLASTITPSTSRTLEVFLAENDHNIGQAGTINVTGGGTWNTVTSDGNNGIVATQLITTTAPLTATSGNMSNPTNVGQCLLGLQVQPAATPVVSNIHGTSGGINNGANFSYTPTGAGDSILIMIIGAPSNTNPISYVVSDTRNTVYTPLCSAQNTTGSNGTIVYAYLASNIDTNARTISLHINTGAGTSGSFFAAEISLLQPSTNTSGFRPLGLTDLPRLCRA